MQTTASPSTAMPDDVPQDDASFVIFLHIHKCAGLTLKHLLRRQHGPHLMSRMRARLSRQKPMPAAESLKKTAESARYFAGHFGYGLHEVVDFPTQYVTFLREPKSRLISLYDYSRSFPKAFYHRQASQGSLFDFVTSGLVFETDNGMTRFLVGDQEKKNYYIYRKRFGEMDQQDVDMAIEHLESRFLPPGITERFDESLLMLRKSLGLSRIHYLKVNESTASQRSEWDNRLDPYVRWDQQLYEWAMRNHEANWLRFQQENPQLDVRFQESQRRYQKLFQRPYAAYFSFKNRLFYGSNDATSSKSKPQS